jgi:pimeloyl-ACP methyl ester carboxylesterase
MVTLAVVAALGLALAEPTPPATATETGFVQVEDDVRLFYQRFGTGTPTLFVPARLELVETFAPLFERFDAVTWDPRGRGLSSRPSDMSRYGLEVEMADAEALRRHFGADRIVYVGISLWGSMAVHYAARHPDHVAGAVALSPLPVREADMGPPANPVERDVARLEAEMAELEADGIAPSERYRYCRLWHEAFFVVDYVDLEDMAPLERANLCQYAHEHPDALQEVAFEGIFGSFGAWDWRDAARSVQAPVLLVYGARENWDLGGVRAYAELIPDVGWTELPNAGHAVWNDEREAVVGMIAAFAEGGWPDGVRRAGATPTLAGVPPVGGAVLAR